MSAKGIRAGRAFVEFFAEDSNLIRGLRRIEKRLGDWGKSIALIGTEVSAAGAAIVSPFVAAAKVFESMGSNLNDMSARTGVSAESLQELGFAAEQTGADMGAVEKGLNKMAKFLHGAANGSKEANAALSGLGLNIYQLSSLKPDAQFKLLGDRISQIQNPTQRAAVAMEVFGKSGTSLLPMLENGAAGLDAYAQQARDLGLVLSNDEVKAADDFGDALGTLKKIIMTTIARVGSAVVPVLMDVVQAITGIAKTVSQWVSANKELLATIFKVGAIVLGVGAAVVALGAGFAAIAAVVGAVATGITTIAAVIGAILSPVGLLIAGLTAGVGAMLHFSGAGAAALGWLGDAFHGLMATATEAWDGIGAALASGNIALAGRIVFTALRMEFQKVVNFLMEHWEAFKLFFVGIFQNASFAIAGFMTDAWAGIQVAWIETVHGLQDAWAGFINFASKLWNGFTNFFAQTWARIKGLFGQDVSAELARLDAELQAKNNAADQGLSSEVMGREKERADARAQIESERQLAQQSLRDQSNDAQAQRQQAFNDAIARSALDLENATREFHAATTEAKAGAKAKGSSKKESPFTPDALDVAMNESKSKAEAIGTFSAASIRGLAADGLTERATRAAETTASNTARIARAAENGIAFSN